MCTCLGLIVFHLNTNSLDSVKRSRDVRTNSVSGCYCTSYPFLPSCVYSVAIYYSEGLVCLGWQFVCRPGTNKTYYAEDTLQVFSLFSPIAMAISGACVLSRSFPRAFWQHSWLSLSSSHLLKCHNNSVQEMSSSCLLLEGSWCGARYLLSVAVLFSCTEYQHLVLQ